MDQVKQLFEKSNVPAAKLWGANFKSGEEWKLSFNYSENDDDIFRIASMTKLLTTISSLQLVEKGKLEMDQPLNDFLPGLADVFVIDDKSINFFSLLILIIDCRLFCNQSIFFE